MFQWWTRVSWSKLWEFLRSEVTGNGWSVTGYGYQHVSVDSVSKSRKLHVQIYSFSWEKIWKSCDTDLMSCIAVSMWAVLPDFTAALLISVVWDVWVSVPLQVTPGLPAIQTEQLLSKLEGAEGLGPNQLLCLGPFAAGITRKMPLTVWI